MKKIKVFFMAICVSIFLLGFAYASFAFDFSKFTSKPVEIVKKIAYKLGFGDNDTDEAATKSSENNAPIEATYPSQRRIGPDVSDFINIDSAYADKVNPWEIKRSFQETIYSTDLSWNSIPQVSMAFIWDPNFNSGQSWAYSGLSPDGPVDDGFSLPDFNLAGSNAIGIGDIADAFGYGIQIKTQVNHAMIDLYGWYGSEQNHDMTSSAYTTVADPWDNSGIWWRAVSSGYYSGNKNLAATVSHKLPFMSSLHQGVSPALRLEAAYRLNVGNEGDTGVNNKVDEWKVGMAYEAQNHIGWLNSSYGINWGLGYSYTVAFNNLDEPGLRARPGSHGGNISANTYWYDMKLYTMFMYLYDRQTRSGMTMLNATYSPDWRWSYGIKANFYDGEQEKESGKILGEKDHVSFSATYRWD